VNGYIEVIQRERDRAQAIIHAASRGVPMRWDLFLKNNEPDLDAISEEMEQERTVMSRFIVQKVDEAGETRMFLATDPEGMRTLRTVAWIIDGKWHGTVLDVQKDKAITLSDTLRNAGHVVDWVL
jgi:hypothetical protein